MPSTANDPSSQRTHTRQRPERPRPPPPAVEAEEAQWLFTEEELLQAPSIVDGMPPDEERARRKKGINFILQVGMMLKIPQTTMSTAAVFFNRYLMRASLVPSKLYKPLHHYQIAATALFLATKVEENVRRMKEIVVACVRVALKDPNKLVDEQTKDFWKWRDTILYNEDVLLEKLCFDLSVESPFKIMYDMLKYYGIEHNKKLRNSVWGFLSDCCLTQHCLLFNSRTIAAAAVYAGARMYEVEFPDEDGKPWWEIHYVKLRDIRRACNMMADLFEETPPKEGEQSIYVGLRSPLEEGPEAAQTRLRSEQTPVSPTASSIAMSRSESEGSLKRRRSEDAGNSKVTNGSGPPAVPKPSNGDARPHEDPEVPDAKRQKVERNGTSAPASQAQHSQNGGGGGNTAKTDEGSEEGEVEE